MTLEAYLAGSDVASQVRLNAFSLTERADGAQGFGSITFDDEDKTLDVRGWMKVVVKETACTTAPVIFSGYIGPRTISRTSGSTTYRSGVSRFIDCTLVDENVVLDIRLFTGTDAKRPAETHVDRLNWMLTDGALVGLIDDTSLMNLSNPRPFDEADYRQQYPSNVLEDICNALTRTSFIYVDGLTGDRALFFDYPDATVSDCSLSISNDPADVTIGTNGVITGDVYPPMIDAEQGLDPSEVYGKVVYTYRNGTVTANSADNVAAFFTDNGLGYRGVTFENIRLGRESTAREFAANFLVAHGVEKDTLRVPVIVPKEKAGLIRAGQRIQVKFTHLDGYEDFTWVRITERQITQVDQTNEFYLIVLELTNWADGTGAPSGGGPGPGDFPHPPPAVGGIVQQVSGSGNIQMPNPITDGNTLVVLATCRASSMAGTWISDGGYTTGPDGQGNDPGGTNTAVIVYKTASSESQYIGGSIGATNIGTETTLTWYELAGGWTADTNGETSSVGTSVTTPTIAIAANSLTFGIVAQGEGGAYDSVAGTLTYTTDPPWTEDYDTYNLGGGHPNHLAAHYAASAGGSIALIAVNSGNVGLSGPNYNYVAQILSFTSSDLSATDPPLPGQIVPWTVVTVTPGSTTSTGTTLFPYADGSLQIKVDGVLISPASYTETDPATGDFTLSWVIDTDEVVTVQYLGR